MSARAHDNECSALRSLRQHLGRPSLAQALLYLDVWVLLAEASDRLGHRAQFVGVSLFEKQCVGHDDSGGVVVGCVPHVQKSETCMPHRSLSEGDASGVHRQFGAIDSHDDATGLKAGLIGFA